MAGESRLSEQESGFNTAKSKGIRLSGLLSQAKARQQQEREEMRWGTDTCENKGSEKELGIDRRRSRVRAARAVWQQEKHDGKLCGTQEQAQPSIRSS